MTTTQDPKWRVECPRGAKAYAGQPTISLVEAAAAHGWTVRSPRGIAVFHARDRAAAIDIAARMAGIDALLAFVAETAPATPYVPAVCTCSRYHPHVWGKPGFCARHGAIPVPLNADFR